MRATSSVPRLFGTMHEAGHAMYEQGVGQNLEGTPLGGASSLGVHESQSRMWENVVGRSRPFWQHFYPQLQQTFPTQLAEISPRHLLWRHQPGLSLADPGRSR